VKLFADLAPKTVENFVSLAEGTKSGKRSYERPRIPSRDSELMIQGGSGRLRTAVVR